MIYLELPTSISPSPSPSPSPPPSPSPSPCSTPLQSSPQKKKRQIVKDLPGKRAAIVDLDSDRPISKDLSLISNRSSVDSSNKLASKMKSYEDSLKAAQEAKDESSIARLSKSIQSLKELIEDMSSDLD